MGCPAIKYEYEKPRLSFVRGGEFEKVKKHTTSYRFGFNGQEKDNEVSGEGNSYDFGARIYDSRLGRFFTIDNYSYKYPSTSPYSYALNNPIVAVDNNGDSVWVTTSTERVTENGRTIIRVETVIHLTVKIYALETVYAGGGGCSGPRDVTDAYVSGVQSTLNAEEQTTKIRAKDENGEWVDYEYVYKFDATVTRASSMSEVGLRDHLVVVVDDVVGAADPNAPGGQSQAGGQALINGQIAYVENLKSMKWLIGATIHELGHNLGLLHDFSGTDPGNYMSYEPYPSKFTAAQLSEIADNWFSKNLNEGVPYEFSNENTDNWFSHTSTQEEPYKLNVNKGDKIPKKLKN